MSASKRDSATQIIRHLRVELRELDICLTEDGLLPEPGQIRALLAQIDALQDLVLGIKKKPSPNTPNRTKEPLKNDGVKGS